MRLLEFFLGRMGEDGVFVGADAINRVHTIGGTSDGGEWVDSLIK